MRPYDFGDLFWVSLVFVNPQIVPVFFCLGARGRCLKVGALVASAALQRTSLGLSLVQFAREAGIVEGVLIWSGQLTRRVRIVRLLRLASHSLQALNPKP